MMRGRNRRPTGIGAPGAASRPRVGSDKVVWLGNAHSAPSVPLFHAARVRLTQRKPGPGGRFG